MADELKLDVVIRTTADVAAIEKTTASTGDLGKKVDETDASLSRLKETLNKLDSALKETGAAGEQAGDQLSDGLQKGAGGNLSSLEGIIPATNINDIIQGAWQLGSEIGGKIGEAMQLANRDKLDWDHLFGDGDELDATALARKHALQDVIDEHSRLLDQLAKPPDDVLVQYLNRLTEQARESALLLGELKKSTGTANKIEDQLDSADYADQKAEIENSGMSAPEKIRARAALDNEKASLEQVKRDERRQQENEQAGIEVDTKQKAAAAAAKAEQEAIRRRDAAASIVGGEQYIRAQAGGADKDYLKNMFDRRAGEMGFDDLGSVKDENSNVKRARSAREAADRTARDAATREGGIIDRNMLESESDQISTERGNMRRSSDAETSAGKAEIAAASKEMADASKQAASSAKAGEAGTKEIAATLKNLASMIGGKNEAMTAALQDMARSLGDGASADELARIKQAADVISQSQNAQAAAMGQTVTSLVAAVQSAAQIGKDAMEKAKALEAQIRSMK